MVTKVAAQQGISVQFTDPEMQYAMRLLHVWRIRANASRKEAAGSPLWPASMLYPNPHEAFNRVILTT